MDHDSAAFRLEVIAGAAVGAWVIGLLYVRRTERVVGAPIEQRVALPQAMSDAPARFARLLAAQAGNTLANAVIDASDEREVRWHADGPVRHRGRLCIAGANGDEAELTIESEAMLRGARIAVRIGAVVVVALYLALRTWVLPLEQPVARAQVTQMGQAVHALWPPFLLAGLARTLRRRIVGDVQRLIRNLPFA